MKTFSDAICERARQTLRLSFDKILSNFIKPITTKNIMLAVLPILSSVDMTQWL